MNGLEQLQQMKCSEQMVMPTKYSEKIELQLKQARDRVEKLERICSILAENPQIEELLTLSAQAGIY